MSGTKFWNICSGYAATSSSPRTLCRHWRGSVRSHSLSLGTWRYEVSACTASLSPRLEETVPTSKSVSV